MTVYVLGAGASKHVGYPLASTMGAELIAWMSKREEYRYTAEFIKEKFGNSPNIEDVITSLDAYIKSLRGYLKNSKIACNAAMRLTNEANFVKPYLCGLQRFTLILLLPIKSL